MIRDCLENGTMPSATFKYAAKETDLTPTNLDINFLMKQALDKVRNSNIKLSSCIHLG